jgi:hypothetical protein
VLVGPVPQEMANRFLDQRCPESPTNVHDFGLVLKDNDFQYKVSLALCVPIFALILSWFMAAAKPVNGGQQATA